MCCSRSNYVNKCGCLAFLAKTGSITCKFKSTLLFSGFCAIHLVSRNILIFELFNILIFNVLIHVVCYLFVVLAQICWISYVQPSIPSGNVAPMFYRLHYFVFAMKTYG